ncbi:hypothetical protein [Burkholderia sp. USMB20]|uniref:hypothetical protein n=1 Tax=Burkholderia sp. USMB20 TaxID=1571773 RepID=UPI00109214A7|nr:hypothetical protein [Burkholderia sp. USMB20]TGN97946.1 hypothetical protein PL79_009070 [Burkholderia sp. USMB20]
MKKEDNVGATSKAMDPFFETIYDGEWNACVGIQGDAENYVDGYLEAALELASAVIDKRLIGSRDTLAMPILYNCRHGLELSLKYAIDRLHKSGMLTQGFPVNHDIDGHWQHLQSAGGGPNAALGDASLRKTVSDLEPFVRSLAAVDDDGQELRYALNRDGQISLSDVAVINLQHVRNSIGNLSEILQCLKHRVQDIVEERLTGTHTSHCSRKDLEAIAIFMGDQSAWNDESFLEKKVQVMKQYGLSGRKFSDAIDSIRQSRPLAALIGKETGLKYISDEKAIEAMRLWVASKPETDGGDGLGLDYFDRDFEKYKEQGLRRKRLFESISALLTVQEFAEIQTLYYLGRDQVLGEHHEGLLANTTSTLGETLTWEAVDHLLSRISILDMVADGLVKAGRPSLARKLRELRPSETA